MNAFDLRLDRKRQQQMEARGIITQIVREDLKPTESEVEVKSQPRKLVDNPITKILTPMATSHLEIYRGENPMADVDTMTLSREHSDIRKEAVDHTNEIVKEGLKGDYVTEKAIKDAEFNLTSRIATATDRVNDNVEITKDTMLGRFFDVGRDTADLRAQVIQVLSEAKMIGASVAKDTEISVLKNTIEGQKNTQYLADRISSDGEKTRCLINDLKNADLNRMLIERNSELVEERHGHYHWRHMADQSQWGGQFAALQQMMQNLNSQLNDTKQGIVNLGTMAGVGMSSTNNNVR